MITVCKAVTAFVFLTILLAVGALQVFRVHPSYNAGCTVYNCSYVYNDGDEQWMIIWKPGQKPWIGCEMPMYSPTPTNGTACYINSGNNCPNSVVCNNRNRQFYWNFGLIVVEIVCVLALGRMAWVAYNKKDNNEYQGYDGERYFIPVEQSA